MNTRLSRRAFARMSVLAAAVPAEARGASEDPVVQTSNGPIRGLVEDGIRAFKGIPYGAPTGGANRFQPAQDPEPWHEIRDAFDYGPAAPTMLLGEECRVVNDPDAEIRRLWATV